MDEHAAGLTRRRALLATTGLLATASTPAVGRARGARTADEDRVAWTFETGPEPPHPAVADGRVVTTDADGTVHALDEESGEELWQVSPGGPVEPFALDVSAQVAAVGTGAGTLEVYDAARGEERWSAPTAGAAAAVRLVPDGVLVTEADGSVARFGPAGDRHDRFEVAVVAEAGPGTPGNTSDVPGGVTVPATDGRRLYVQNETAVHAFPLGAETTGWTTDLPASHAGKHPVFPTDDTLVVAANDRLTALSRASGEIRWEASVGGQTVNSPVTDGEVVVSGDFSTQAVLPADAQIAWEVDTDPYWSEGLSVAPDGDEIYVAALGDEKLLLRSLSARDGATRWSHPLDDSDGFDNYLTRPAVGADHVVVGVEGRGELLAVQREAPASGPGDGAGTDTGTDDGNSDTSGAGSGFGVASGVAAGALASWRLGRDGYTR